MNKQQCETWTDILSLVFIFVFGVLAGMGMIQPIGFVVGVAATFVVTGISYEVIEKIFRKP